MKNELSTPGGWQADLDTFATWLRAAGRPPSTVYKRLYDLRRFANESGIDSPWLVTIDDLADHVGRERWAAGTRHAVRSSLRVFYRWGYLTGRIQSDPAALLPSIPVPAGKPRPAHDVAVQKGLRAADPRVQLMVRLGAHVGLRCCEIARVHRRDVVKDLVGYSLRVNGKGGKTRVVPISDAIALELLAHDDWVFPGQIDGHLSAGYVSKLISRALPEDVTAHPLRHRFASKAYKGSGNNIRVVQELLGHSSVATTQVYTAVEDADLRRGALSAA